MPHDSASIPDAAAPAWRFTPLVVALLSMFLVLPLFSGAVSRVIFGFVILVVLISAAVAILGKQRTVVAACLLLLPSLVLDCMAVATEFSFTLTLVQEVLHLVLVGSATVGVLVLVLRERNVTPDTLAGALAAYLLMGLVWSIAYSIVETVAPGSFSSNGQTVHDALYYFSFVTLTTLGYGDITPLSEAARSLALLEAIVGQFYLAVLVAKLVGTYLSQAR